MAKVSIRHGNSDPCSGADRFGATAAHGHAVGSLEGEEGPMGTMSSHHALVTALL